MTTPTSLWRARIAVSTVATVTLASALIGTPVTAAAADPLRPTYSMAVALLSESSDGAPVFGVADSELYNLGAEELAARLGQLRELGVTDLRVAVPWVYIEAQKGTYDWAKMDAVVAAATAQGFTLTGAVTATPAWAGLPLAGAPDPARYAAFAGSVAERYGSQIAAYEVWNEPNGVIFYAPVNPAGYTEMLKAAYTAIKAANPDATVLAGALGATGTVSGITLSPQQFLARMYDAGAAGYFDALSYHPYHYTLPFSAGVGTANSPVEQVKALHDLMVANGDGGKQIWATEYGTATTPGWGVTQAEQAAMLRDFLTAWSKLSYTGPAFVYSSQDVHTGILNHEYNFGLFTSHGNPKLAAQVLAELITASGLGELPDYAAPRMSAARDLYLQLASVGFGLANQALVIPNAAIAIVYNLMPRPVRQAFTKLANAVSQLSAAAVVAVAPAAQAMVTALVSILPKATPSPTQMAGSSDEDQDGDAPAEAADADASSRFDADTTGPLTGEAADAEPPATVAPDPAATIRGFLHDTSVTLRGAVDSLVDRLRPATQSTAPDDNESLTDTPTEGDASGSTEETGDDKGGLTHAEADNPAVDKPAETDRPEPTSSAPDGRSGDTADSRPQRSAPPSRVAPTPPRAKTGPREPGRDLDRAPRAPRRASQDAAS